MQVFVYCKIADLLYAKTLWVQVLGKITGIPVVR